MINRDPLSQPNLVGYWLAKRYRRKKFESLMNRDALETSVADKGVSSDQAQPAIDHLNADIDNLVDKF